VFSCVTTVAPASTADNPIVQTNYTADPAPLVHDGKVYVYTGHDEDTLVNDFFTMNEWRVYSSADIVNWTDHGSPLRYSDFSWSRGDAWAGQVIERNGRFFFYIPTTSQSLGRMAIGVAASDDPTGPFTDALGGPLITENCGDIDPTVFIDDDDQAYLYWGNPNLCYVRLNADMISYQGPIVHVPMTTASFGTRSDTERPTTYEEGPWFYKRNDLYYLVFAAGPISEHIGYATSPSATGPWTYGGVVMPTQGTSFTNHPGVVDFLGNSYFFYHSGALPGGGGFHRSVCVERFTYGANGTIPTINMTAEGAPQVAALDPYQQTEAETMAWGSGIETETCSEGGMDVTSIGNGDYVEVKGVDFGTGAVSFDARVAAASSGGSIELRLDSEDGTLVGTCSVSDTGGAQAWMTTSCAVSNATDQHDLYLKFVGGSGASLFNVNWWKFTSRDPIGGAGGAGAGGMGGQSGGAAGTSGAPLGGSAGEAGSAGVGGASGSGAATGGGGNGGVAAAAGAGQLSGAAGSAGVGASSGAGGSVGGASGASGASGATTGGAGMGFSGRGDAPSTAGESSGCGCAVPRRGGERAPLALFSVLAVLAVRSRRRERLAPTEPSLRTPGAGPAARVRAALERLV